MAGKLVRDLIPDIIRADGGEPAVRVLDAAEYERALDVKLLEEAEELRQAAREQRLEEAADVYEVLSAIAAGLGLGMSDVAAKAAEKRGSRGGFERRLWLEQ